jgi:hypothetical protein
MMEYFKNPPHITLQITFQRFDGTPKLDVTVATVRVFHVTSGGSEVVDLAVTPLVQVGASSAWRYVWVAPALSQAGGYIVEYTASDADVSDVRFVEDLFIVDDTVEDQTVLAKLNQIEAKMDDVQANSDDIKDAHLGRQKLDATDNTFTLYRENGDVLKVFDIKDDTGAPSVQPIFERIPRP